MVKHVELLPSIKAISAAAMELVTEESRRAHAATPNSRVRFFVRTTHAWSHCAYGLGGGCCSASSISDWTSLLSASTIENHLDGDVQQGDPASGMLMSFYASFTSQFPKSAIEYTAQIRAKLFSSPSAHDPDAEISIVIPRDMETTILPLTGPNCTLSLKVVHSPAEPTFWFFSAAEACRAFDIQDTVEDDHWLAVGHIPAHTTKRIQVCDGRLPPCGRPYKLVPRSLTPPVVGSYFALKDKDMLDIQRFGDSFTPEQSYALFVQLCRFLGVYFLNAGDADPPVGSFRDRLVWMPVRVTDDVRYIGPNDATTIEGQKVWCTMEDCLDEFDPRSLEYRVATLEELAKVDRLQFYMQANVDMEGGQHRDDAFDAVWRLWLAERSKRLGRQPDEEELQRHRRIMKSIRWYGNEGRRLDDPWPTGRGMYLLEAMNEMKSSNKQSDE